MMGIPTVEQRRMMGESLDAIMQLLRAEAPVTMKTDWFELKDARLQLASFSDPHLPVAVATSFTPSGPSMAGRHGAGLLSVAGVDNKAFERTWGWAEEAAQEHGQTISREHWKVVVPIHVAETRKAALAEIEEGYKVRPYSGDASDPSKAGPGLFGGAGTLEEQAERGSMLIGSPDQVAEAIEQIIERSGGVGGILGLAHEWASTDATNRSYELFARYAALPGPARSGGGQPQLGREQPARRLRRHPRRHRTRLRRRRQAATAGPRRSPPEAPGPPGRARGAGGGRTGAQLSGRPLDERS
jgi:limonene 1,2-monooxygenase